MHKDILTNGSTMLSRRFLGAWDPDCIETLTEAPGRSELACLKFLWNSIGQFFFNRMISHELVMTCLKLVVSDFQQNEY